VGSIVDESRNDGKVVITNSSSTGNDANASIDIAVEDALNLILQTSNSRYTIDRIQTGSDLTLEVVNTAGKKIPVVLGELISGGNVTVNVPYNVESADANKVNISGNAITLNAGGMVGTDSKYLRIDSSVNDIGGVTVIGSGGIYLKEADGDLYITEIRNDGTGNIALWTQNGSINVDPNLEYSDAIEKLNGSLLKYAEYGVIWSDAQDMIEILVQYLRDLIRIQNALKTEGEEVLSEVKMEIDVLHDVTSVEEALAIIAEQLLLVGGTNYQDPDAVEDMMDGAVTGSVLTDEFKATVETLVSNPELAGLLSEQIIIWRDSFEQVNRYLAEVLLFAVLLDSQEPIISGNGDLLLHLESADGTASVSQAKNSLSISIGGKVTITTGPETALKDVYLESYDKLTLDPIVASDEIDLYSLNGMYA
ncbi:MAG: hypothetical protein U0K47_04980, partial [Erysipelotrichaceae bacterium]|nr:hypothetical protein [Erysipelotrichaceae bacterium]